jgi:hypothetical protein
VISALEPASARIESRFRSGKLAPPAPQRVRKGENYGSFNQHWHKADIVGLTCWSAIPAAQQHRPANINVSMSF